MALALKKSVLFQTFLEGMFDEAYIFDAGTMALLAVSEAVYMRTGQDFESLKNLPTEKLVNVSREFLNHHMQVSANQERTSAKSKPAIVYVDESQFKILNVKSGDDDYLVVIKNDASSKEAIAKALSETETRFKAIVANTPGLVCQFRMDAEGDLQFDYLSDHCIELLGFTPLEFKLNGKLFYEMMNPRDRSVLRMRLKLSREDLGIVNWDGRVWIDAWQDTKWINMRSTPRKLINGDIQWDGLITNITQSMDKKFEIEESRRRLSELTAHMNSIREDERQKIACEIHDDLGGNLTAIKIGLSSVMQKLQDGHAVDIKKLQHMEEVVDGTYEAIHRISSDLRPNIIEFGIVAALEWQAGEFKKQYNIPCYFNVGEREIQASPDQAMALFRICQEAMSNIAKYAKASEVNVNLNRHKNEVEMIVLDDGIGIKPIDKLKDNSFGLRGMQERVTALNGHFKISRLRGRRGTQVHVRLPLD